MQRPPAPRRPSATRRWPRPSRPGRPGFVEDGAHGPGNGGQTGGAVVEQNGAFREKGKVAVTYRVSGGGHAVVETLPVATPFEMVTVYHLDGDSLVLTHYCATNTQPRMRSRGLDGAVLAFDFDGGTNIDPARTSHMHSARLEFVSADELRSRWQTGRTAGPTARRTRSGSSAAASRAARPVR